jgi:hypothetical protein
LSTKIKSYIAVFLAIVIASSSIFYEKIFNYLYIVLELGSKTRGVDSGGSGRTELWQRGLDLISSRPEQWLFGGGLRWSTADTIGFSVESSYITIILDSGVIAGSVFIAAMVHAIFKSAYWSRVKSSANVDAVLLTMIVVFALAQSFSIGTYLLLETHFQLFLCLFFHIAQKGLLWIKFA